MKYLARYFTLLAMLVCLSPAVVQGQETSVDADSVTEFLKGMTGEWEVTTSAGGQTASGTESSRMIGRWFVSEIVINGPDGNPAITGIFTVGFDAEKDKITGTWVDSMQGNMWHYTGELDGNVLTLSAKGPNPQAESGVGNYKDIHEMSSKDAREIRSEIETPDGSWTQYASMTFTRKQ